jgi:hypothetical protein
MALSANSLAGEILNAINGNVNNKNMTEAAMRELGHAIARYLTRKTTVKYTWAGQIPGTPPTPDPVTSYTTKKVTGDFICTLTHARSPVLHGIRLGKQITDGIRKFSIFPEAGWVVPTGKFLCSPAIVLPPYPTLNESKYWVFQSGVILRYYTAWVNPALLPGTHGYYIGAPGAVMSNIY